LYKHDWAKLLIFSGAASRQNRTFKCEAMKRQALAAGIPSSDILLEETSETTKQNAANATNLFSEHNIHSVILVTSAYHQRRAGLEFGQRAGMTIRLVNHPVKNRQSMVTMVVGNAKWVVFGSE